MKFFFILLTIMMSSFAQASFFVYEGHLTDDAGVALSGNQTFRFVIKTTTCQLYIEQQTVTVDADGHFAVLVGTGSRLDSTGNTASQIFGASGSVGCFGASGTTLSGYENRTMDVYVNNVQLSPSITLSAVPVAQVALQAEAAKNSSKLEGHPASDFVLASNAAAVVSANETDPTVQAFAKTAITTCGAGQVITYNGTAFVCVADQLGTSPLATASTAGLVKPGTGLTVAGDGTLNVSITSAAPSGTAGGDLTGTYPNPTLNASGVAAGTYAKVTVNSKGLVTAGTSLISTDIPGLDATHITAGQFADARIAAVSVDKITSGSTKYFTYQPGGSPCATNEILKWNGSQWACGVDQSGAGGGTDAISLQTYPVSPTAPGLNNFLSWTGTSWFPTAFPNCTSPNTLSVDVMGNISCNALSGLTNSAISASADISRTKLAAGTANHVLINNGSGVIGSEAQLAVSRGGTGQSTFADGQLLIGKTDGTLARANITAGSGVTVTNGDGTITIAATATSNIADDSITNVDINSAAAIARTKLASGTANRLVVNNGSGVMNDAAAITPSRALISDANGIPTQSVTTSAELAFVNGVTSSIQAQLDALTTSDSGKLPKAGGTMTGSLVMISNIMMNAQNEVRLGDADSTNYVALRSPATVTTNQVLTLPGTAGASGSVLQTDGAGNLSWATLPGGAGDASYAAKGVVQFDTDAPTSGISVASGVAKVNYGTGANQIVKLDASGRLPAVDGSALTNLTNLNAGNVTSGTLPVIRGGTGRTSYTPSSLLMADGTGSAITSMTCLAGEMLYWNTGGYWTCGKDLLVGGTASAVNNVKVTGTVASGTPTIEASGSDTNINLNIMAKGSGKVYISSPTQFSGVAYHNGNLNLLTQKELQFFDSDSTNYVGFRAASDVTSNQVWTLPTNDGAANSMLTTNGSGTLSWTTPTVTPSSFGSQSAKTFLAAPNASTGTPSFRSLVAADLPTSGVTAGTYTSVTVDTYGRVTGATSPTTIAGYGITDAVKNISSVPSMQSGLDASKPAAGTTGRIYISSDTAKIYRDSGSTWDVLSPATGAASGDLTGTYPAPTIAAGAVTTPKLFTNPGANRLVATDASTGATLAPMGCSTLGQTLTWTATGFTCSTLPVDWITSGSNIYYTTGNVGIGNTSPDSPLFVQASVATANYPVAKFQNTSHGARIIVSGTGTGEVAVGRNGVARWSIMSDASTESSGNLGSNFAIIRYSDTGTMLGSALNINRAVGTIGIGTTTADATGTILMDLGTGVAKAGNWTTSSDARLKNNIKEIENPLEKILKLRGVTFDWDRTKAAGNFQYEHDFGVIAQEVEAEFPQAVIMGGDGYRSVNYSKLVSPLIGATHELYGMCKANEARMTELETENAAMKRDIASIKEKAAQIEAENAALKKDLEAIKQKLGL